MLLGAVQGFLTSILPLGVVVLVLWYGYLPLTPVSTPAALSFAPGSTSIVVLVPVLPISMPLATITSMTKERRIKAGLGVPAKVIDIFNSAHANGVLAPLY